MKLVIKCIRYLMVILFLSSFTTSPKLPISQKIKLGHFIVNDSILADSTKIDTLVTVYTPYKENAHASYYHDKFNGKKTASGEPFSNDGYTAAHRTLTFGTKLKITNTVNNESVVVTVNDRGPFVPGREIDLSKKAFMEIAKFKLRGYLIVNIDIIEDTP